MRSRKWWQYPQAQQTRTQQTESTRLCFFLEKNDK